MLRQMDNIPIMAPSTASKNDHQEAQKEETLMLNRQEKHSSTGTCPNSSCSFLSLLPSRSRSPDTQDTASTTTSCWAPGMMLLHHEQQEQQQEEDVGQDEENSFCYLQQTPPPAAMPFPLRLHRLLNDAHAKNFDNIIDWIPQDNGFKVFDHKKFESEILPNYFYQTKYKSFTRQLNMYNFVRVTSGVHKGAYVHELFVRGKLHLSERMKRKRRQGAGGDATKKNGKTIQGGEQEAGVQVTASHTATITTAAYPFGGRKHNQVSSLLLQQSPARNDAVLQEGQAQQGGLQAEQEQEACVSLNQNVGLSWFQRKNHQQQELNYDTIDMDDLDAMDEPIPLSQHLCCEDYHLRLGSPLEVFYPVQQRGATTRRVSSMMATPGSTRNLLISKNDNDRVVMKCNFAQFFPNAHYSSSKEDALLMAQQQILHTCATTPNEIIDGIVEIFGDCGSAKDEEDNA